MHPAWGLQKSLGLARSRSRHLFMNRPPHTIQPRVMVIVASDVVSGPAKGIFQLLQYNQTRNVRYHLYNFKTSNLLPDSFLNEARQRGIDAYLFENGRKPYVSLLGQARREVRKNRIHIVQTHGYKASILGLFLKWQCKVKWVCSMHGRTSESFRVLAYQQLDRILQNFADRVVFVSQAERDATFCRGGNGRVRIIHNCIDLEQPAPVSKDTRGIREKLGIGKSVPLISVISRLSPEKGVDIFIRAFAEIRGCFTNARGLIVGDGCERRSLEKLTAELGLGNAILFVSHTETPGDFIAASDLIVLPSRYEGIPNVALEAMAFKKPVVATRVGGTPEVIESGISGLLVPPEDPQAIYLAIREVLCDPATAQRLATGGYLRVRNFFSPKQRALAWFELYEELQGQAKPTSMHCSPNGGCGRSDQRRLE